MNHLPIFFFIVLSKSHIFDNILTDLSIFVFSQKQNRKPFKIKLINCSYLPSSDFTVFIVNNLLKISVTKILYLLLRKDTATNMASLAKLPLPQNDQAGTPVNARYSSFSNLLFQGAPGMIFLQEQCHKDGQRCSDTTATYMAK